MKFERDNNWMRVENPHPVYPPKMLHLTAVLGGAAASGNSQRSMKDQVVGHRALGNRAAISPRAYPAFPGLIIKWQWNHLNQSLSSDASSILLRTRRGEHRSGNETLSNVLTCFLQPTATHLILALEMGWWVLCMGFQLHTENFTNLKWEQAEQKRNLELSDSLTREQFT